MINYFENDGDYASDRSIEEDDYLNMPQHRRTIDPPARISSANSAPTQRMTMHHLHKLQTFVVILEVCVRPLDTRKKRRDCWSSNNSEAEGDNDIMDHSSIFYEILINDCVWSLKESLEYNIYQWINQAEAFDVLDSVILTALVRYALFVSAETSEQISRIERLRMQRKPC